MDAAVLWLHAMLLASVRLTFGLALTPLFSAFRIPAMVRLIVVLSFAALAANLAVDGQGAQLLPHDGSAMLKAVCAEAVVGVLLAVGVHVAFAAFGIAGRVMDAQMGFGLAAVLDPVSGTRAPVLASGLNALAVVLFFVSDTHHALLAGFFRTFELLPLGAPVNMHGWYPVAEGAGAMFALGFTLAAPVVVALLLADVVVAVVSRNLPQMNVLFLSIPIKVLLGLAVLAVALPLLGPVAHKVLMLPLELLDKVR